MKLVIKLPPDHFSFPPTAAIHFDFSQEHSEVLPTANKKKTDEMLRKVVS